MPTNLRNLFYTEKERDAAALHDPALVVTDVDLSVEEIDENFINEMLHFEDEISILTTQHQEICAKIHIRKRSERNMETARRYKQKINALNRLKTLLALTRAMSS